MYVCVRKTQFGISAHYCDQCKAALIFLSVSLVACNIISIIIAFLLRTCAVGNLTLHYCL